MTLDEIREADRIQSLTVDCPEPPPLGCLVPAGRVCINVVTLQPLAFQAAHECRLRAAGVHHEPIPAHELLDLEGPRTEAEQERYQREAEKGVPWRRGPRGGR